MILLVLPELISYSQFSWKVNHVRRSKMVSLTCQTVNDCDLWEPWFSLGVFSSSGRLDWPPNMVISGQKFKR